MHKIKKYLSTPNGLLILLLSLWTILNLFQGAFTELSNDEAYYWVLSHDVGFGYFDHPPMFAWLIGLSTAIFGDTEFGVRALTILLQPIYLYLFWKTVRPSHPSRRSALLFFLVAFSIPLLQLYGFIATPDAPLLMFTALLLWLYKRFLTLEDKDYSSKEAILTTIGLGVTAAALCYSKYHGVLVIGFIVLSNMRLFLQPRFYIAILVAAACFVPHLLWQYSHNWVSFKYHLSDRTASFELENLTLYLLNTLATFNPLLFPFFIAIILKRIRKNKSPLPTPQEPESERKFAMSLKYLTWGFLLFFLSSVRNVHIQPQWLIPVVFPMLYFMVSSANRRRSMRLYVMRVGFICAALFVLARIFIMTLGEGLIHNEIFDNKTQYSQLNESIKGRPFLTNGNYMSGSKMRFYCNPQSTCLPNVETRSSHYEFLGHDQHLYMKPVAIEISDSVNNNMSRQMKDSLFSYAKIHQYDIWYDTISNYIPTSRVRIECTLPSKSLTKTNLPLEIKIINPYPYNIPLGQGRDRFELFLHLRRNRFQTKLVPIKLQSTLLPAQGVLEERGYVYLDNSLLTGDYAAGFTLVRYPYGSWFHSSRSKISIIRIN